MTRDDVIALLRTACDEAGSIRQWCLKHKVSQVYALYVLRGERNPGPMILNVLGLEREEATYRRKQ